MPTQPVKPSTKQRSSKDIPAVQPPAPPAKVAEVAVQLKKNSDWSDQELAGAL